MLLIFGTLLVVAGCGGEPAPVATAPPAKAAPAKKAIAKKKAPPAKLPDEQRAPTERPHPLNERDQPGMLGDLLKKKPGEEEINFPDSAPLPTIDEEKVAAQGIRKLVGKHLTLYTDVPSSPEIDELPRVFDAAVPQWQAYFHVADAKVAKWQVWGYLMQDKAKFQAAGLYPDDLPEFAHGYQRGHEFWLNEQPTTYYRRHLMLHEGTHAAMYLWLGGAGPPWYSEGMAELFGTHRWADGKLTTNYLPRSKTEVEGWGRVKIIKDAFAADKALTIGEVLKLPPDAHKQTPAYAWSWAAAKFFDSHPRYQQRFRELSQQTADRTTEFSTKFITALKDDLPTLQDEWQLFIGDCEYGYDIARNTLAVKPVVMLPAGGGAVEIAADHAWQSSGFELEANKTYRLTANGRYLLGKEPKPWWCEPGGVTVRYHRGQPLGMLLAEIRNDANPQGLTRLLKPVPIGLDAEFTPAISGTLWLKINDHEAEFADNAGTLKVRISPE
ncbi:MAG TPA: hypothetical protein VL096_14005 [Pirellulaceae bacterium]|nr:hypothetical protein [Pirellulaceae bacterium]